METAWSESDTVVIGSVQAFEQVTAAVGHLIPVGLAWRMADVSRPYLYRLLEEGRLRRFVVYGLLHVAKTEWDAWRASR